MARIHALTADEKEWAAQQVAMIIGTASEDTAPLVDFLAGIGDANELQSQLLDMLGESPLALDFAFALIAKRFPPEEEPKPAPAAAANKTGRQEAAPQQTSKPQPRNSSIRVPSAEDDGVVAYRKADPSDISYFAGIGGRKTKKHAEQQQQQQQQQQQTSQQAEASPDQDDKPSEQKSRRQLKKERQQAFARQREEEERQKKLASRKRTKCECQASEHSLFTNCLTCGRIICELEGPGPCMFCNSNVESPDQQLQQHMRRLLRRAEEPDTDKQQEAKGKAKHQPARAARGMLYSTKAGGGIGTREAEQLWPAADDSADEGAAAPQPAARQGKGEELSEEEYLQLAFSALGIDPESADPAAAREAEAWVKATRRKERLLDYDRTAAQRTKLIDQTADFDPYSVGKWMSPEEKIEAEKKRAARIQAEEDRESRLRRGLRVLRLNFQNSTVEMTSEPDEAQPAVPTSVPPTIAERQEARPQPRASTPSASNAGAFAHNPLLGGSEPKFVLSLEKLSKGSKAKGRSKSGSVATGPQPSETAALASAQSLAKRKQMLRIQNEYRDELF
ncbi:hypothetical protein GGI12_001872 [Dipsacomyces acuminosporus]|nr:hypothetical protein GGI12_001872 [Dipsacomyces acuminosporus]